MPSWSGTDNFFELSNIKLMKFYCIWLKINFVKNSFMFGCISLSEKIKLLQIISFKPSCHILMNAAKYK